MSHQQIDYRGTTLVTSSKVSSGMPGHATKPGVFSILEKQKFHHSNIYSGAPMPWMQRLTRSGTALHGGVVPGYPASHGCVRLPFSFAPRLFQMTAVGENVLVANDRLRPKLIEHPTLFQPLAVPVALAMAHSAQIPQARSADASDFDARDAALLLSLAQETSVTVDVLPTSALIAPDRSERALASAELPPGNNLGGVMAAGPLRILVTRRTPRDQAIGVQNILSELGYPAPQNFDGTIGKATVAAVKAFQRANGLPENGAFNDDLVKKVYKAAGKTEPPEGHLFVRQGFSRVFDIAIAILHPDQPLGTHLYTALNFAPGDTKTH